MDQAPCAPFEVVSGTPLVCVNALDLLTGPTGGAGEADPGGRGVGCGGGWGSRRFPSVGFPAFFFLSHAVVHVAG